MAYEIEKKPDNLPDNPTDLNKFILIGREKLTAYRAKVRAIDKLVLSKSVRDQAVKDGQDMGEALLVAEAKLGELLKGSHGGTFKKGGEKSLPEGITKKQSHFAQKVFASRDLIPQIVADAKENEDIPTRTELFRKANENAVVQKKESLIKNPKIPEGVFNVVYADPPLEYTNTGFQMSAENQYPTMSTIRICEMKLPEISNDAALFLWVTNPLLNDGLNVCESWGFEYKTNMVWVKDRHTAGFYVFGQHELLLICIRGSMLPIGEKVKSIIYGDNKKHSKKPEIVYEIIEKMYPNQKYVELFARNKRKGWDSYGNEI